jgi:hypothetical protein
VDIQTEIGNLIQELSFQKSQGKSVMLISTGLEICQSVHQVQVQFNPKFSIMQPSREWTIAIVHTRISYPNPERVHDSSRDLMYLLYVILIKKNESPIRPCLEI